MIKREDFIFALGYEGEVAIVDGRARSKYRRYTALMLAEAGLYKPAICAALYDRDDEILGKVLEVYNRKTETKLASVEELKRIFGVSGVPEGITKVNVC